METNAIYSCLKRLLMLGKPVVPGVEMVSLEVLSPSAPLVFDAWFRHFKPRFDTFFYEAAEPQFDASDHGIHFVVHPPANPGERPTYTLYELPFQAVRKGYSFTENEVLTFLTGNVVVEG